MHWDCVDCAVLARAVELGDKEGQFGMRDCGLVRDTA